ncbi:PAS domain-containing protein [Streptomyces sp. NPDC003863]
MATAVLDHRGDVIGWDSAAQDLYGYPAEEALGKPARAFLVPADGRPLFDQDRPVGTWGDKRVLRRRDGNVVDVVLYVLTLGPPTPGRPPRPGPSCPSGPSRWSAGRPTGPC